MDVLLYIIFCLLQGYVSARCGFPGSPAHCLVTFSDEGLEEGTVASYECERGFELLGPSRRVCDNNGKWTPDGIPFCVINVAAGKAPMQASTAGGGAPQRALDGSTARAWSDTCTLTKPERVPWWYVNLLEPYMVQLVRLDFGQSCCDDSEPPEVVVRVGNNRPDLGTNPVCNRFVGRVEEGQPLFLPCNPPMPGAFVSVHLQAARPQPLSLCEAFVYTDRALPVERCPQFRDQPPGSTATYNGKCYIFYDDRPATFSAALAACRARGGTLIDETNPALQGFISWELWRRHRSDSSSRYWLGAVREGAEWRWLSGQELTLSFWSGAGGRHECAQLDGAAGWLWAEADCHERLHYVCQHRPKACGRPEQPPNSTLAAQRFTVGASVEYSCDEGHLLVGPAVRTCLDTGFYDEFPPVCKRIECGFPAEVSGGSYRLLNGSVSYLAHVQYQCEPGHELLGRSRLVCDIDERWNGPPPRCEAVQCGRPGGVAYGRLLLADNSSAYGSEALYSCEPGHVLRGAPRLRCLASGLWDHPPPLCVPEERPTTTTSTAAPSTAGPTSTRAAPPTRRPPPTPFAPPETTRRPPSPRAPTTTTRQYERPPERTTPHPSTQVPHIIVANHAKENQIHSDNILEVETPGVRVPAAGTRRDGALPRDSAPGPRFNVGAVVALAAFGVLIFLIAIVTTAVILCKSRMVKGEKYEQRLGGGCPTEASLGSSSEESRSGLGRYYAQAWEQLHEAGAARLVQPPPVRAGPADAPRRHHHHHHHRERPRHERRLARAPARDHSDM